jgi:hypothetical protein
MTSANPCPVDIVGKRCVFFLTNIASSKMYSDVTEYFMLNEMGLTTISYLNVIN